MVVLECSVNSLRRYSENSLAALPLCHQLQGPFDPTHHRNLKVMILIECQASEAKPTIEYTSSISPIASTMQTSEPPAQAGTNSSVGPPNELRDRASDGLGDDEASLVEAHKAMLLSKLCENDSTRLTEP